MALDVPNDTHAGTHERLATKSIVGDLSEDVEDGRYVLLKNLGYAKKKKRTASQYYVLSGRIVPYATAS